MEVNRIFPTHSKVWTWQCQNGNKRPVLSPPASSLQNLPVALFKPSRLKWWRQVQVTSPTPGIAALTNIIPLGKCLGLTQKYLPEFPFNSLFPAIAASVVPGVHPLKK